MVSKTNKKRFVAMTASVVIAIVVISMGLHYSVYSNLEVLGPSTLQEYSISNESNPQILSHYLQPNNDPPVGLGYVYFPQTIAKIGLTFCLIPPFRNITETGFNISKKVSLAFGASFSVAMLSKSGDRWYDQIGFRVSSVHVKCNNTSYSGEILPHLISSTSADAMAVGPTSWNYGGPAYNFWAVFLNDSNQPLKSIVPGLYTLYVNLSVYALHVLSKTFLATVTLNMPWAYVNDTSGFYLGDVVAV